jgi:phosphate:Na+ symporter
VTAILQSSTATCLMTASFAGRGVLVTAPALAVMLGADIGTTLIAQLFSLKITWLSPLLIIVGLIAFQSGNRRRTRDFGRLSVGLGLMLLSLQLIVSMPADRGSAIVLTRGRSTTSRWWPFSAAAISVAIPALRPCCYLLADGYRRDP